MASLLSTLLTGPKSEGDPDAVLPSNPLEPCSDVFNDLAQRRRRCGTATPSPDRNGARRRSSHARFDHRCQIDHRSEKSDACWLQIVSLAQSPCGKRRPRRTSRPIISRQHPERSESVMVLVRQKKKLVINHGVICVWASSETCRGGRRVWRDSTQSPYRLTAHWHGRIREH